MANKKVTLVWYCKTPRGWRYFPVVHQLVSGRVVPKKGIVKEGGQEVHYPKGRFMLRAYDHAGRNVYTAIDSDIPEVAQSRLVSAGMRAVRQRTDADKVAVLKNATKAYIKDRQQSKAPEAAMQARVVLDEFVPLCKGITYTKAVTREHVLAFHNALRERGCSDRTVANKHRRLKSFFLFCKIDTAFLGSVPKYENKLPTIYSPSEVKAIREASDPYMRLVVDMALKLGLREQELCFSTWEDIDRDNAVFRVQGKPRLGFAVKDSEQRDVPIPADLLTGLTEWYQTHKGRDLILGTASDKPNTHLLRTLKRLAKRAGLNCGKCDGCQGKLGECQEWTLHKFRRTYLTTLLRNGLDLKTVQHYAGHSDLASTMRYLRPASTSETQDRINAIKWE